MQVFHLVKRSACHSCVDQITVRCRFDTINRLKKKKKKKDHRTYYRKACRTAQAIDESCHVPTAWSGVFNNFTVRGHSINPEHIKNVSKIIMGDRLILALIRELK